MALIQALTVDDLGLTVKFEKFIKVSSLVNSAFSLVNPSNVPVVFKTIDQFEDYNSVSRTLRLYFDDQSLPVQTYTFTITGVLDAADTPQTSDPVSFTFGDATPSQIAEPVPDPVFLTDKSIRSQAFMTSETIFVSNVDFYVAGTDPETFNLYVPPDYNSGRVTIRFSNRPDASVLNGLFFKAQRKLVQRLPARWETIPVHISIDNLEPWVYIDYPSDDASPVYTTPGHNYFVPGYKYRIILSKDIGS